MEEAEPYLDQAAYLVRLQGEARNDCQLAHDGPGRRSHFSDPASGHGERPIDGEDGRVGDAMGLHLHRPNPSRTFRASFMVIPACLQIEPTVPMAMARRSRGTLTVHWWPGLI